jgi:Tfp pilus assembly protein PilN
MGPDDTIEKFVLAGDDAEAARQALSEEIPDCELIGSAVRFEMPPENKGHLQEAATSLGLAYSGLIRRPPMRLNLLPQELRIQQTRWAYVPSIIFGLVIIFLLAGLWLRPIFQEKNLAMKLDQETLSLKPRVERVQAVRSQAKALQQRIDFLEGLLHKRDMNLEILQELTTLLPSDTFLYVYQNRDGGLQLNGASPSAPDLIPKLDASPLLKDVVQRGTIFRDQQTGKDRFIFEAKVER